MPCGVDHSLGSWSLGWWQGLEQVAQALRQVKPRSSEVAEKRCLMPPGHSWREAGLAQSPRLSLVFRECPGKREQRRGLNPGRLPGEADFGVSSRVPGLDCIWLLRRCSAQRHQPKDEWRLESSSYSAHHVAPHGLDCRYRKEGASFKFYIRVALRL